MSMVVWEKTCFTMWWVVLYYEKTHFILHFRWWILLPSYIFHFLFITFYLLPHVTIQSSPCDSTALVCFYANLCLPCFHLYAYT